MGDTILRNEDIIELKKCIFSSMVCLTQKAKTNLTT